MIATEVTGTNLIAGHEIPGGASTFHWVDPRSGARGDVAFTEATAEEVRTATRAAAEAFPELRTWPDERVADLLHAIADALDDLGDRWLKQAAVETGLDPGTRLTVERVRTTGQLRFFAEIVSEGSYAEAIVDPAHPDASPVPRPDVRRLLVPLGPVAVFGASNFPLAFAVAGGDTASALAARCPVVYKAHPSHPGTDELGGRAILSAVEKVGAPDGIFSLVHGVGHEIGQVLVAAPEVRAVGFTGSLGAGRALHDLGASRDEPIPVYAEMGSTNPVFVTRGAARKRTAEIAEGFVGSMMQGGGQWCTKPGLIFVPDDEDSGRLVESIAQRLAERPPSVMLNERICRGFEAQLEATSRVEGVEVVLRGGRAESEGFLFGPALLATTSEVFLDHAELLEEHFGPASIVVRYAPEQAVEMARRLHGSLTATIHAEPHEHADVRELQDALVEISGRVVHNGFPTGVAVTYAMHHGGPYPATSSPLYTSVGATAIRRFLRPVSYQDAPDELLPAALQDANPRGIVRLVDGRLTRDPIQRTMVEP